MLRFCATLVIENNRHDDQLSLPGEVEESLALVELFRQQKLSHFELSKSLGISRLATDALLKRHNVIEDLLTLDELRQELGPVKALEK